MFQQFHSQIESNLLNNTNNITDEIEHTTIDTVIPYSVRFVLLLIFEIPSIICYIFVISYILNQKTLRSASNNYIMLIILFISFMIVIFDIPWELDRYRRNRKRQVSLTFCRLMWFIDLFSFYSCQMLVAWASFERHLLIFQDRLFNQKWKKICFHYLPPIIIICYMMIFYLYVLFGIPCENSVVFGNDMCITPCYLADPFLGLWESIFHSLATTISMIVLNILLFIRVYYSRTRLQQSIDWRKYRKMIFQLFSVSTLFLSTNLPYFIIYIIYMVYYFDWALTALECLAFFGYFIPLLLPFIVLSSFSKLWKKLKMIIHHRTDRQIEPIPLRALLKNTDPSIP